MREVERLDLGVDAADEDEWDTSSLKKCAHAIRLTSQENLEPNNQKAHMTSSWTLAPDSFMVCRAHEPAGATSNNVSKLNLEAKASGSAKHSTGNLPYGLHAKYLSAKYD